MNFQRIFYLFLNQFLGFLKKIEFFKVLGLKIYGQTAKTFIWKKGRHFGSETCIFLFCQFHFQIFNQPSLCSETALLSTCLPQFFPTKWALRKTPFKRNLYLRADGFFSKIEVLLWELGYRKKALMCAYCA